MNTNVSINKAEPTKAAIGAIKSSAQLVQKQINFSLSGPMLLGQFSQASTKQEKSCFDVDLNLYYIKLMSTSCVYEQR